MTNRCVFGVSGRIGAQLMHRTRGTIPLPCANAQGR
jgi:hypothetical protein